MRIVEGRYVLTNDPFREGGMSTVAKAFDPISSRFCAIKRMKGDGGDDIRWKESFNREYAALSELSQHQNIVTLLDAGTDDDGFFMVLEWVSENLVDRISTGGALSWHDFYHTIGRPILGTMAYAQGRGWNHRDIKPQNILIGDGGVPKLSDYGMAKQFEKPSLGLTFGQFRSAPFTPPEDDGGERSCSIDCFSWVGCCQHRAAGLRRGVDRLVSRAKCLEERNDRYPPHRRPFRDHQRNLQKKPQGLRDQKVRFREHRIE
jgi:serine/threonine protein kinase